MSITIQQLYKEATKLVTKTKFNTQLSEDDRSMVVTDATMKVWDKMQLGIVPTDDFENYKHYLFTTLKNFVLILLKKKIKNKLVLANEAGHFDQTFTVNSIELISDDNPTDELPNNATVLAAIEKMNEPQRTLITMRLTGATYDDMALAIGKSCTTCRTLFDKGRAELKKLLRLEIPIYSIYEGKNKHLIKQRLREYQKNSQKKIWNAMTDEEKNLEREKRKEYQKQRRLKKNNK